MRSALLHRLRSLLTGTLGPLFPMLAAPAAPAAAPPTAAVLEERARMRAACAAAGGPGTKEGWAILWREGLTMWDLKGPTPVLYDELTKAVCAGRVRLDQPALVPGCGSGYDVKGLADAGLQRVVGVDIAEEAIAAARKVEGGGTLLCADFFADQRLAPGSFGFVFDYTFFCALPPSLRAQWGQRTAELLAPGGRLLSACCSPPRARCAAPPP
jgi:SAM-dependent methyltransferase